MVSAVAIGTSHCGAGCSLGDLIGEFTLAFIPGLAVIFGFGWLFDERIFAAWVLDFVLAYLFGVSFSTSQSRPCAMCQFGRDCGWRSRQTRCRSRPGRSACTAPHGDRSVPGAAGGIGRRADALTPEFWWMMQLAVVVGFCAAYPVNWMLIRRGIKEKMRDTD
jgi:hypothetical protein